MRVLISIHRYPPYDMAGAEAYIHALAKFLLSKGHEVRALFFEASHYDIDQIYVHQGIEVFPVMRNNKGIFEWADIVITHLGYAPQTIGICNAREVKRPCVFISHNTWVYDSVLQNPWVGVIYNSLSMKENLKYPNRNYILRPACSYKDYDTKKDPINNQYITLINLNKNKGAKIFFNIAKAMPGHKFLAVRGGYDAQYPEDLKNVKIIENSDNILDIYRQTRILLMPSKYESWGMCATEAMSSGIPVIYSPTFGLNENVGKWGIKIPDPNPNYEDPDIDEGENPGIDPANYPAWVKAIKKLDDKNEYRKWSVMARKRSRMLDPTKELEGAEQFLKQEIKEYAEVINSGRFQ